MGLCHDPMVMGGSTILNGWFIHPVPCFDQAVGSPAQGLKLFPVDIPRDFYDI